MQCVSNFDLSWEKKSYSRPNPDSLTSLLPVVKPQSHWLFPFLLLFLETKIGPILDRLRLNIKSEYALSWSRLLSTHVSICNICSVNQNFGMKPLIWITMNKIWLLLSLLLKWSCLLIVNMINRAEKRDWGSDLLLILVWGDGGYQVTWQCNLRHKCMRAGSASVGVCVYDIVLGNSLTFWETGEKILIKPS